MRDIAVTEKEEIIPIAKALSNPTRYRILRLLLKGDLDVTQISKHLNQTEANISFQVQILQNVGLINCKYMKGKHGVRKVCKIGVDKITIDL